MTLLLSCRRSKVSFNCCCRESIFSCDMRSASLEALSVCSVSTSFNRNSLTTFSWRRMTSDLDRIFSRMPLASCCSLLIMLLPRSISAAPARKFSCSTSAFAMYIFRRSSMLFRASSPARFSARVFSIDSSLLFTCWVRESTFDSSFTISRCMSVRSFSMSLRCSFTDSHSFNKRSLSLSVLLRMRSTSLSLNSSCPFAKPRSATCCSYCRAFS
mmetsp:Transcript_22159/g.37093  ORF Transcript_22159/g.37093 Transcript_22159/m.37093 type:complete len:214 (-) Transcript_22159:644-1285(-)